MNCCIVKRKATPMSFIPIVAILLVTSGLSVLSAFISAYLPVFVMVIGVGLAVYKLPSITKSEYEYNLEGDTFSVAIIKNNSSRKELFISDMEKLVSCTPQSEAHVISFARVINSASEGNVYCAVFTQEEKTIAVNFSPSEEFMKSMRLVAPLKVKLI